VPHAKVVISLGAGPADSLSPPAGAEIKSKLSTVRLGTGSEKDLLN
jgi:hypothetical protein